MNNVNCDICERTCAIPSGGTGACGRYGARDGAVAELFPDRYIVACPISIETMPILHFHPGARFLQISTTGCNFDCPGCVSTVIVREMAPDSNALLRLTPQEVVQKALDNDCCGVTYVMNDPLAGLPSFIRVAELARAGGVRVGCSSNAYFTEASLSRLLPHLDFINLGIKGFSDRAYRECGATGMAPVLRNLKTLHENGVHVEVSCILTRDNHEEVRSLARHVSGISRRIPLQVMRFIPLAMADISLEPSIREAEGLCAELGELLDYVYLFNSPGTEYLHTPCPECGEIAFKRDFYGPMGAKLITSDGAGPMGNACHSCGRSLDIVGKPARTFYQEGDFEGGYPFTRALEIIEAMLIAMGVSEKSTVVRAWESFLSSGDLKGFHKAIQNPKMYIGMVRHFGGVAGVADRGEALASCMEQQLTRIETALAPVSYRPRVYYAMGKPLFYIRGGRLENQLVETAGGTSVNRRLEASGRPGRSLSVDQLNELDPEIIFISAFISNSVEDFHAECLRLGVTAQAVRTGRIYTHPAPGWDFGSPQWILGLMFMATTLHGDLCSLDVTAEAEAFYRRFYGIGFSASEVNRSFSKPVAGWRWNEGGTS
jgi:pyruvate-formate lyase-activating enzyme